MTELLSKATMMALALLLLVEPASAARQTIAIAPLGELGISRAETTKVRRWLRAAMSHVPGYRFVASAKVAKLLRKRKGEECAVHARCLASVGRLAGVDRVVAGDVGRVGRGWVIYVRLIDVAKAKQIQSISAVLDPKKSLPLEMKALAYQLLAPQLFSGTLEVRVSAKNSWIYLNGQRVAQSPAKPFKFPVGTHALRVTNETYRDYVRFVRVRFDETTSVDVDLEEVPIASRKMKLKPRLHVLKDNELPWYRRWWVVAGMGVGVMAAAAVVFALIPKPIDSDRELVVPRP